MTGTPDIIEAIKGDDETRVKTILASDPESARARDETGLSAVLTARYCGKESILADLLAAVPELDVFEAAAVGDAERVSALVGKDRRLARGWSVDGFTPLHLGAFFRHPEVVDVVLENGAEVDVPSKNPMRVTPLHSAAASRATAIAAKLVERGAEVNARQEGGFVPLHAAAQNGDVELARLLLSQGADPALATDDGRTAADFAREARHEEILRLLPDA